MIRLLAISLIGSVLSLGASTATAEQWRIDPGQGRIGFEYLRDGVPAPGTFDTFEGEGIFDPADPAAAELVLRIESRSIDLNDTLASGFATSAEWFDSRTHPQVIYDLQALRPLGEDRYTAYGLLTIRGQTRPIETEIVLNVDEDRARATGAIDINRTEYLLGVGPSSAFVEIGPLVTVSFDLVATPVK